MAASTLSLLESLTPFSQGAEAKVYKYHLHGPNQPPILLKYRFPKKYRHQTLDASLTKGRIVGEARMLMKCMRSGVRVPGVRMVDAECGVLGLEWIEGMSVRRILGVVEGANEGDEDPEAEHLSLDGEVPVYDEAAQKEEVAALDDIMQQMGIEIAKMHLADVIHGDLTTSNMMIRPLQHSSETMTPQFASSELILIDFGLSFVSNLVEDKAVDLYVLERAFTSTHPDSEPLFDAFLKAYAKKSGKAWAAICNRLISVRLRGRKRSMIG